MKFTLEEIKKATNTEILENIEGSFEISTDTRTIKDGDLYLPLKGANFNGEDFFNKALENGAVGCFYTSEDKKIKTLESKSIDDNSLSAHPHNIISSKIWLKVPDTLTAYLKIANFARQKFNPIVVGVTGSSGKTTTKEMVYAVLSQKFKTHKTYSNHNNEIGFCQTTLAMEEDCEVLIIEMGMRGLGEIELISKYAQPDYAIITNAGSAHVGRLGSLDNIAIAKCEITKHLKKSLIAHNSERLRKFSNFNGDKIFYSVNDTEIIDMKEGYSKFIYKNNTYELNVDGEYNIENSLSAIEIGYKLGMTYEEIKTGLLSYKPIEKRWETKTINGFNIINDSYNANPESMKASVSTFLQLYKNPVVILGDMGELGENEINLHKEVGLFLKEKINNISTNNPKFIFVGPLAKHIGNELDNNSITTKYFNSNIETSRYILDNINAGSTIFLKASRSMKFEEIIENLEGKNI